MRGDISIGRMFHATEDIIYNPIQNTTMTMTMAGGMKGVSLANPIAQLIDLSLFGHSMNTDLFRRSPPTTGIFIPLFMATYYTN